MNETDREEKEFPAEDLRPLMDPLPSPSIFLSCETRDDGRNASASILGVIVAMVM